MSYNLDLNIKQIKEKQSEKKKYEEEYYELISTRIVDPFNADMSINEYSKLSGYRKILIDKIALEIKKRDVEILEIENECVKHEEAKGNIDEETAVRFLSNFHKEVILSTKRREAKYLETTISELQDLKDYRIYASKKVLSDRITNKGVVSDNLNLKDLNKDIYNLNKKLALMKIAALDNKYAVEILTRDERKKEFNEKVKTLANKIFK